MEVSIMVLSSLALDQYVHIDLHVSANLIFKNFVHQTIVCCICILEPKEHDHVTVESMISYKGSILLIFGCHLYLVITIEGIYKGEELMIESCIN